jgi:hypothetical protein
MFRRSPRGRPAASGGHGVPDDPDALNALGVMLKNQGRLDEAEFLLRRAAAVGDANALNNLGNVLEVRGDKPGAAMYWRQAAERGLPQAMCSLAMYLVTSGELAEADSWYRKASGKAGSDPKLYGMLQLIGALLQHQRAAAAGQDLGGESSDDSGLPGKDAAMDEEPRAGPRRAGIRRTHDGDPRSGRSGSGTGTGPSCGPLTSTSAPDVAYPARSSFRVTGGISVARKDGPVYASRKPTESGDDGLPPPATRGHPNLYSAKLAFRVTPGRFTSITAGHRDFRDR